MKLVNEMKNNSCLILLVSLFLIGCKEIKYEYFPNGNIEREIEMIDGKRNGKIIKYYETGKIKSIFNWKNDTIEGDAITYDTNGIVESKSQWKSDKLEGKSIFYYPNGNIVYIKNHKKGILNGQVIKYYENGKVEYTAIYKDSLFDGSYKVFFESNGWIKESGNYRRGILHDKYYEYSEEDSGKVMVEEDYINFKGEKTLLRGGCLHPTQF